MRTLLIRLRIVTWIAFLTGVEGSHAQHPTGSVPAAEKVKTILSQPWTKLQIASVLLTDYGTGYVAAIEIVRDRPEAAMRFRPLQSPAADLKPLSDSQLKALTKALIASASEVEKEITPGERLEKLQRKLDNAKTPEEVAKVHAEIRSTLPSGWDYEELNIRSNATTGSNAFQRAGAPITLNKFFEKEFSVDYKEISRQELKNVLGKDPYE